MRTTDSAHDLPILASAVLVFIVSSIIHMALTWHKGDFRKIPNEDQVTDALRPLNIPYGDYVVPRCDRMKDMKTPEFKAKTQRGPVFIATFMSGEMAVGKSLVLWFVYLLVISYFAAYVGAHVGAFCAIAVHSRRIIGITAFLSYGGALCQASIWYQRSWGTTVRSLIDSVICAAVTAGTFGWLWH
jgi:hypothetical protein